MKMKFTLKLFHIVNGTGNNSSGDSYGKRFWKERVLGVFLNMNKGTSSLSLDGVDMGVAFRDESLKRGPIYAAWQKIIFTDETLVSNPTKQQL